MPEERRLAPFADELLELRMKDRAIQFLEDLRLPSRISAAHLTRWARYVGAELTPADYARVRQDLDSGGV